jgi:FAD/FMN-containing dehydrogenase
VATEARNQVDTKLRGRIGSLRESISGEVLTADDPGYDDARSVTNGIIDRHPAVVVACATDADVVRAIAFALENELPLSIKGGGHGVSGKAVCDGGVAIVLSPMNHISIDQGSKTARVGGGATWGQLDAATHAFGLATVGGVVSTTGVAGLTLGGGYGWLSRSCGLSCDNLLAARVVTADGRTLTASAEENPDLYWALRGGGGNFGVVTEFEFRLHPVSTVLAGLIFHPIDRATELMQFYRDFAETASDRLSATAAIGSAPDGSPGFGWVVCYNGDLADGDRAIQTIRDVAPAAIDTVAPVPYPQHQKIFDSDYPPGTRSYWKSSFLEELGEGTIDALIDQFMARPSLTANVAIEQYGGAVAQVAEGETAFAHRNSLFNLLCLGRWYDPEADDAHIAWTRKIFEATKPWHAAGAYVNYLTEDDAARVSTDAYHGSTLKRLEQVKRTYDPDNVFRINNNITPSG